MAVPKKRKSLSRRKLAYANVHPEIPSLVKCPSCGAFRKAHSVCTNCGYYRGNHILGYIDSFKK